MSETMRAVRYHDYGASSVLVLESVPKPQPQAGEVLVKVSFAGVNPVDWKLRSGLYKAFAAVAFPATPGLEFSGVIEAVGTGVTRFKAGQKVFGAATSAYAEYIVTSEASVALVPEGVSMEAAASVPVGSFTAWDTVDAAHLQPGQTVIVLGAAGGVGLYAAQLAKLKGTKVWGVASTSNLPFVKALGVEAVDYKAGPVSDTVSNADVVIDTVGGEVLDGAFALVKKGGILLTVAGRPSEEKAKQYGITVGNGNNKGPVHLAAIAGLLARGKLITEVGKVFPFSEAGAAHDLSQSGHGRGRILLKV